MKIIQKKSARIILIISGIILILSIASIFIFYRETISYDQTINEDVSSEITVIRDRKGIPCITALSKEDMYFALGYLHGIDRYPVMNYYRSLSKGNIVKIYGHDASPLENLIKASGIREKTKTIISTLSSENLENLRAYCRGINSLKNTVIYKNLTKQEWAPEDIITVLIFREWAQATLNNLESVFPLPDDAIRKPYQKILPKKYVFFYSKDEASHAESILMLLKQLKKYTGTFNRGFACYHRGTKSADLFAVDSSLNIYPDIYPVHVKLPDTEIKGLTLAGLPFFCSGKTGNITFHTFTLNTDVQNFILHKTRKINGLNYYQSSAGWKRFTTKTIQLNSGSIQKEIRMTDKGPVLNDLFEKAVQQDAVVSLEYPLPDADLIDSLFALPFEKTPETAYNRVFRDRSLPRVYLFSNETHAIKTATGIVSYGADNTRFFRTPWQIKTLPVRDLSFYRQWSRSTLTAGSDPAPDTPYHLRKNSLLCDQRYTRIQKLLDEKPAIDEKRLRQILDDTQSPEAVKFIPVFSKMLKANPVTSARLSRIYFHDWNMNMESEKTAPAIFTVLLETYIQETLKDELGEMKNRILANSHYLHDNFFSILNMKSNVLFNDTETEKEENHEAIFDRAFLKSMRYLNRRGGPVMDKWKWGSLNRGSYHIPEKQVSFPGELFKSEDHAFSGSHSTINRAETGEDFRPEEVTSLRGYFFSDKSRIKTSFAYSVNPISDFSYAGMKQNGFIRFHKIKMEHMTLIIPAKKRKVLP